MRKTVWIIRGLLPGLLAVALLVTAGCSNSQSFSQQNETRVFVQNYDPPYLDILWVVNDTSAMSFYQDTVQLITQQAGVLFSRLDGSTDSYRMAVTTADMAYNRGQLMPQGNGVIFEQNEFPDLASRLAYFTDIWGRTINLNTGAQDEGFAAGLLALQTTFTPRANVPLVLVFVSDADDHSTTPDGSDAVTYYSNALTQLKGDPSLVRVYSVNYVPLQAGQTPNHQNRCATQQNADIDQPGFQNRYFRLALQFASNLPNPNNATANLCQGPTNPSDPSTGWGGAIDLSGLSLTQPQSSFNIDVPVNPSTLQVTVIDANGNPITDLQWTYDASTGDLDFTSPPPGGARITAVFQSN